MECWGEDFQSKGHLLLKNEELGLNFKYSHKNGKLGMAMHSCKPGGMVEGQWQKWKGQWDLLVISIALGSVRDHGSKE